MKDEALKIRVSKAEKQAFERAAEISGEGVSSWARRILRTASVKELQEIGEHAAFLAKPSTVSKDEKTD